MPLADPSGRRKALQQASNRHLAHLAGHSHSQWSEWDKDGASEPDGEQALSPDDALL